MADEASRTVTRLLSEMKAGEAGAADLFIPLVYNELRALAGRRFRSQRRDHTLQLTALVHEAFVKLVRQKKGEWQNRSHF